MESQGNIKYNFNQFIDINVSNYNIEDTTKTANIDIFKKTYASIANSIIMYQKLLNLEDVIDLEFFQKELNMNILMASVIMQPPGSINILHTDKFYTLRKKHTNIKNLVRVNIFLEDWKIGHIVQTMKKTYSHWKQGDYIIWDSSIEHLASNLGIINKLTLQFSGSYNETCV